METMGEASLRVGDEATETPTPMALSVPLFGRLAVDTGVTLEVDLSRSGLQISPEAEAELSCPGLLTRGKWDRMSVLPAPGPHHPTVCLCGFDNPKYLIWVESYGTCLFFDRLLSLSIMSSRFIHVVACVRMSFIFKTQSYSIVCMYPILLIHLSVRGHLGCFHVLAE